MPVKYFNKDGKNNRLLISLGKSYLIFDEY